VVEVVAAISIIPIGRVAVDLLDYLALALPGDVGAECVVLARSIDPRSALDAGRRQYYSTRLLQDVLEIGPAGRGKILAVADIDLCIPILTFVFGEAQLGGRAAVMSGHRLRQEFYGLPPDTDLYYARCEKEAAHELGHTYGLRHCQNHQCVMQFSNSVEEVDLKPSTYCGRCSEMLPALRDSSATVML
jgi:archaemetzincin